MRAMTTAAASSIKMNPTADIPLKFPPMFIMPPPLQAIMPIMLSSGTTTSTTARIASVHVRSTWRDPNMAMRCHGYPRLLRIV
jgi:hypothetical protein